MELQAQQSHRWVSRMPNWPAAAVAGLVAGALAMVIDLLWTTLAQGGNPWHTSHQVAALLLGPGLLEGDTQSFKIGIVATALAIHYALGIVFGCLVAWVATSYHYEGDLPVIEAIGACLGLALFFINFYALQPLFPWVQEMRSGAYLIEHMVFGVAAAMVYWKLAGRGSVGG